MAVTADKLNELYADVETCAKLVGLQYINHDSEGIARVKRGKGFAYQFGNRSITGKKQKSRIANLAIPPAWQNVWICTDDKGHVQATGLDERGRKQYIYHPKWRTMRDLIKFYRMIMFANALPKIRLDIDRNLAVRELTYEKIMAIMLWILDNTYIRIGNDVYFEENESVGLTTLTDKNLIIAGPVITFAFKGKSGKDQTITLEHAAIAKTLSELTQIKGARLFHYQNNAGDWQNINAEDINRYLHELTDLKISAKDFRTWGGTLLAFRHLLEERESHKHHKTERAVIAAVDQAAAILGNTRAVARRSYVHPHLLAVYGSKEFAKHYSAASRQKRIRGLDKTESELLHFLERLFENEFALLKD